MKDRKKMTSAGEKEGQKSDSIRDAAAPRTIFVVDDERVIALLLKRILEKAGFSVFTESDSVQALKFFQARHDDIDILMCDMSMPKMTGEVFIHEALKLKPDMPTVLMSGNTYILPESLKDYPSVLLLEKPLEEENVLKALKQLLVSKDSK